MFYLDLLPDGLKLRVARVAAGLTLFDVGARAGISPPRLSEFERGQRMLTERDLARVWAVVLGTKNAATAEQDDPAA